MQAEPLCPVWASSSCSTSGLVPPERVTAACARALQVQEATDLDVDFLFVDVYNVLPELYQAVEVVFMGSSMDRITSSGERWEPELAPLATCPAVCPFYCCSIKY